MNILWYMVWADWWGNKSRTILAIISIAAGVSSVGVLFGMIDLELAQMDAAHQRSKPSHISLILRNDADNQLLTKIAALDGVAGLDSMTQLTVRYAKTGDPHWQMATLIIRPDYSAQKFDKTLLQTGDWPTGQHIALENLSVKFSGLQPGDSVDLETANGRLNLPINGIVRHPFVKPPNFGGQVHFFAGSELAGAFGVPAHSFRQLLVQVSPPYSPDKARSVAHAVRTLLNANQIPVNVTLLQDPEKHWGRPFFSGVNLVLQIMALAALALCSVQIFNAVTAHIDQQTYQIGIIKALGGSSLSVGKLYVAETLLTAGAAVIVAVPIGMIGAYFSSCKMLALFNIECLHFQYSLRAIAYMMLGGLLIPLLAAAGPIYRGAAMTVRTAIASYGLGADFGRSRLDLWMEKIGAHCLPTLYAAALGNLFRRKAPLLLTQSVLIIAGVTFLVLTSLIASLNQTLDNDMARSRYAVRLGFSRDQNQQTVQQLLEGINPNVQLETWRRLPLEIARNGSPLRQKGSLGVQLLALPAAGLMYQPLIENGRWLQAADAGQRVVVINADSAALNGIQLGDSLDIQLGADRQNWQVVGTYRWLAGNNFTIEPVYAPLETLQAIDHVDAVSLALLGPPLPELKQEADYLQKLKDACRENAVNLDVYTTIARLEQRQFAGNQFRPVIGTLAGLAAMIATVGVIGLSGALATGVMQRTREIGVLRSIGAPGAAIFRLFLLEGIFHAIGAWLLTVPLAYFSAAPIAAALGETMLGIKLDYNFAWPAVAAWLLIICAMAAIAAYLPARKAASLTVGECLGGQYG